MVFGEQTLDGFLEARDLATGLIREQGDSLRSLSLEEAIVLQVAAYVYRERPDFFGYDLANRSRAYTNNTYGVLRTFIERDKLFEEIHRNPQRSGEDSRLYMTTHLGKRTLELFMPEPASVIAA